MANLVIRALRAARQGDYGGIIILCCPHWLVGLVVPVAVSYFAVGWAAMAFIIIPVTIVLPYGFAVFRTRERREDSTRTENDEIVEEQPNDNNNNNQEEEEERPAYGSIADLSFLFQKKPQATEEKDNLLIVKKVIRQSTERKVIDIEKANKDPKSDLHLPPASQAPTYSQRELCSICLEEYQDGDVIAYSRNNDCQHAHHHACLLKWLENHTDCPACRRTFHV